MPQCASEEVTEKTNKKKRWWGDLFRRSNKNRRKPSDSSSDEEDHRKRGLFLGRKRHSDRGSKDVTNSFLINPGLRDVPKGRSLDSVKSPERSTKRRIKAKVEASRELLKDSSSDEASSYTSSLHSGGSFPRRSRAARTERHIRRLSRDLELQNTIGNKSKWSANVVYQECMEYDRKYRAKARSATPSPAHSPKVKRPAGRATSFDNIKSSPPPPPPRKLPEQRPASLDAPMRIYNPPVYTAPPQPRMKSRFQTEYVNETWLPSDQSPEDAKKPPAAPPRKPIHTEERRRQQNHLEEALNELEAIYKKLASEDGQDNQSDMTDRPLEDDMAYRRLNKREPSCQDVREIMSQAGSYLLVSPTLSPPPIVPHSPVANCQEPDIISDDVVYRTMQHTNNTLKINDPQPPFGIPLGPISPSPPSDYLHVEAKPRFDYRPSKLPDIVRDDLAFRNLRKDAGDLKKKKAVRSLSANLTNLMQNNNNFSVQNNNLDGRSYSFQDIPEELRKSPYSFNVRRQRDEKEVDEDNRGFLADLCASESDLLRELEEEARATSVQLDEELRQLSEQQENEPSVQALYSRSMSDLLKELTKNLDYDFGFNDESPVVLANCQTCDTQTTNTTNSFSQNLEVPKTSHHNVNNNRRIDIAECRRQFFESPHFNRKVERESFMDNSYLDKSMIAKDRDNPLGRYNRSPSNPETMYKDINGLEYRLSRSPLRTISADSSGCKDNIKSFIERPFTRTSRSPVLESSKSFNEKYSPRLSRSPVNMVGNYKHSSFSNKRNFIPDRDMSRVRSTRSPVNLPNVAQCRIPNELGRANSNGAVDRGTRGSIDHFDLLQRNRSPVNLDRGEKVSPLLERHYSAKVRPTDFDYKDTKQQFLETYRKLCNNRNNAYIKNESQNSVVDEMLAAKSRSTHYDSLDSFDSNVMLKSRTTSEDSGSLKNANVDLEKEVSRSFDSGVSSKRGSYTDISFKQANENRVSYNKPIENNSLRSSPGLQVVKEHRLDAVNVPANDPINKLLFVPSECISKETEKTPVFQLTDGTNLEFDKPIMDRMSMSPSMEAIQKRRSYASSADTQIDEQYPREVETLPSPRTPIDLEAIERDTSSREPSPSQNARHGCPMVKYDSSNGGATSLVRLVPNDVTNWREEDNKQGEPQINSK